MWEQCQQPDAAALVTLNVLPAVSTVSAVRMDDARVAAELDDDIRLTINEHVAAWLRENAPDRGTVWAMCASSALYALIDQPPPFRYSWFAYFSATPEALPMLYSWLQGADAPEYVVAFQSARRCDPSGELGRVISSGWSRVAVVDDRVILRRDGG